MIVLLMIVACGPRPEAGPQTTEPATERLIPLGSAEMDDPDVVPQSKFQGSLAGFEPPEGADVQIGREEVMFVWHDGSSATDRGRAVMDELERLGFAGGGATEDSDGGLSAVLTREGRVIALGGRSADEVTVVTVTDLGNLAAP